MLKIQIAIEGLNQKNKINQLWCFFFFVFMQVFDGNKDGGNISCCELPYSIVVRYIRFKPVSWDTKICLRVGVFGTGNVTGKYKSISD